MAANKIVRFGPISLTTTLTTNILNPPTLTGGVVSGTTNAATYFLLKHVRIVALTGSGATYRFWIGATGGNVAGTEVFGNPAVIGGNASVDLFFSPAIRLDAADFLVGGLAAGTATMTIDGEIGIA